MVPMISDEIISVANSLGWTVDRLNDSAIFKRYSPAGEDFFFSVELENPVQKICEYAESFDENEHIEMWIEARAQGVSGVPTTIELVQDASDIHDMLRELASALQAVESGKKRGFKNNKLSKLCYELYKLDWKRSHMITYEREADSVKDYFEGLVDSNGSDREYTYADYSEEFGYDGELYACYDEFLDSEYRDEDYIKGLLDNDVLFAMYKEEQEDLR